MARKKGIVKQISNYGEKHPYVTLALAGTFGYYLYENMIKVQPVAPLTEAQRRAAFQQSIRDHEKGNTPYQYDDLIIRQQMKMAGLGATTSTSTTSSSSHRMPGPGDGETSMYIDPTKSGMFGLGRTIRPDTPSDKFLNEQTLTKSMAGRRNPPAHLMFDEVQRDGQELPGMSGFSPSARRRVGHASKSSGLGYSPSLDTQFSNQEAMITGDLKKHEDILGFSGLMPLSGGDWYE